MTSQQEARRAFTSFYEIAGRVLSVRSFDEWSARSADKFISGWHATSVAGAADFEIACTLSVRRGIPPAVPVGWHRFEVPRGHCYTDRETSYYAIKGSAIVVHPPAKKLIEVWVDGAGGGQFPVALSAALRRCGLYELHAAGAIEPESGAGVLISGPSGSGKSTITVRLALSGWQYLNDDIILLSDQAEMVEARGFRRVFSLTDATVAACDLPRIEAATRASAGFDANKRRLDPQVMFPVNSAESCVPKALFFPIITNQATSRVVKLTQSEAMTQLIRMCPWACYDAPVAQRHLRVLARLARQSVSYLLHSGRDLLERPGFASEFLASHMRAQP